MNELSPGIAAALFLAAAAVVWWAGTRLARYADQLAERTGMGRAVLGILLLGGVTALPELSIAVAATLDGAPELSVSNVLGSISINFVILAIADAVYGRKALTAAPADPALLLQGSLGIVLLALVVAPALAGDVLVWGMGAWTWVLLAAFVVAVTTVGRFKADESWVPAQDSSPPARNEGGGHGDEPLRRLLWRIAGVAAAIVVAGYVLAQTGESLAEQTGLGTSFFGAVLLALSTSLPEVSTVIAAVRLGRHEMALADGLGSIMFNVATLVVVDALHGGDPVLPQVGRFAGFGALLALTLIAVYLVGMIERRDRTIARMGFDSIAAIVLYLAGTAVLYGLR